MNASGSVLAVGDSGYAVRLWDPTIFAPALPGGVRLVQHLFVERHLVWIFELSVIAVEDRAWKVALYIEHRVRYSVAVGR